MSFEELLDHDTVARDPEAPLDLEHLDRLLGLLLVARHEDALATGQSVGLEHDREFALLFLEKGARLVGRTGDVEARRRDLVLLHEFLGEHLAGLDLSGRLGRPEHRQFALLELIGDAQSER